MNLKKRLDLFGEIAYNGGQHVLGIWMPDDEKAISPSKKDGLYGKSSFQIYFRAGRLLAISLLAWGASCPILPFTIITTCEPLVQKILEIPRASAQWSLPRG